MPKDYFPPTRQRPFRPLHGPLTPHPHLTMLDAVHGTTPTLSEVWSKGTAVTRDEALAAAKQYAGYTPVDTPVSPRRSAYQSDDAGAAAFVRATERWIMYRDAMLANATVLTPDDFDALGVCPDCWMGEGMHTAECAAEAVTEGGQAVMIAFRRWLVLTPQERARETFEDVFQAVRDQLGRDR